jgi:hypothetical protein
VPELSAAFLDRAGLEHHLAFGGGTPPPIAAAGDPVPGPNGRLIFPLRGGAKAFAKANTPGHRYLCANEWVAASLGLLCGFPLLPIAQLVWDGTLYMAWPYIEVGDIHVGPTRLTTPEFIEAAGSDLIPYQAAALDAWLVNPDRHDSGNVIVVRNRTDLDASSPRAFLHDHDRACFYLEGAGGINRIRSLAVDVIDGWDIHSTAWLREDASWREGVARRHLLALATERCRGVDRSILKGVVRTLPAEWCPPGDCAPLLRFLLARQRHLASIIAAREDRFPNLEVA